jgi:hypothetical protein
MSGGFWADAEKANARRRVNDASTERYRGGQTLLGITEGILAQILDLTTGIPAHTRIRKNGN